MAADTTTKPKPQAAPKQEAQPKAPELLKVAYTKTDNGKAEFGDVVIFGTADARSDFLRDNPNTWWRIADLAKGQTLLEALAAGKPNG